MVVIRGLSVILFIHTYSDTLLYEIKGEVVRPKVQSVPV